MIGAWPRILQLPRSLVRYFCFIITALGLAVTAPMYVHAGTSGITVAESPSVKCQSLSPRDCLGLVIDAVGGKKQLDSLASLEFSAIEHTQIVEQSYRQEPFLTSYERVKEIIDFKGKRIFRETKMTWPESDPGPAESSSTVVAGPDGGVRRTSKSDQPCSLADIEAAGDALTLGPLSVLLAAGEATDLHFEDTEIVRSTPHLVFGFTSSSRHTRLLIDSFNLLPDAIEITVQLHDFWFYWGDVSRRMYFDNWKFFRGFRYPSNTIEERNGIFWRSTQILELKPNTAIEESQFAMDPSAKQQSSRARRKDAPVHLGHAKELASGVTLFESSWNATIIKQDDGILLLECPLSSKYVGALLNEINRQYPNSPIKAVLSTSDSWPHVGGIRQVVAGSIPIYVLDLNQPLLERMVKASHTLDPDVLSQSPKQAQWHTVSQKVEIGHGTNRVELYPLRGVSTERQYLVYFPEHKLLYASDTLSLHDDGGLYDPELMYEVSRVVEQEHLDVSTVYAMHQGPTPWSQVLSLVRANTSIKSE